MVAISAIIAGILSTGFAILTSAITSVVSLAVNIAQAYIHYFTFIINITRRDS